MSDIRYANRIFDENENNPPVSDGETVIRTILQTGHPADSRFRETLDCLDDTTLNDVVES